MQVSVANAKTVWVRDSSNAAYQVDITERTFNPVPLIGSVCHMAAKGNDGTLWHVKPNDPDMHRFLAEEGVLQKGIPVKPSWSARYSGWRLRAPAQRIAWRK